MTLAAHQQLTRPPIDIVKLDRRDLTGPQPQPGEQQQHREIASADQPLPITCREHPGDRPGSQPLRQRPAPQVSDLRNRPHQRRVDQPRDMQIPQQRPQVRGQVHRAGHRPPRALPRQERGHVRHGQPLQLKPADPLDTVLEEQPCGTLVVLDRPGDQPPLPRQVRAEIGEQLLNRPRHRRWRRQRADLPQVRERYPQAQPRQVRAVAGRLLPRREPRRHLPGPLPDSQLLPLKPAAQLAQLPHLPLRRSRRIPPCRQPLLIPLRVRRPTAPTPSEPTDATSSTPPLRSTEPNRKPRPRDNDYARSLTTRSQHSRPVGTPRGLRLQITRDCR